MLTIPTERILRIGGYIIPETGIPDPVEERAHRLDRLLLDSIAVTYAATL